ncbi:capsule biosynthesis protein [Sphingobium sp. H39-3-25]|uniref:capsular polysaccharide export protein, LipB/KpsS family n=1 Tax=Sphingobium arseniciresistens TaxID=3030834 RepID=UPI0023B90221|nr:capsule biosynthesis protein [Sphingobium arseniciresistens]
MSRTPLPTAFLRAPPFPGAKAITLAHRAADSGNDEQVGDLIAQLRVARVGGTFWAGQPNIPAGAIIACPWDAVSAAAMIAHARTLTVPLVFWISDPSIARRLPALPAPSLVGAFDPWHMAASASALWANAADERLLIARLAHTTTMSFPVGEDCTLEAAAGDALLSGLSYADPFTGTPASAAATIGTLAHWRALIDANRSIASAAGMAFWKRETVAPLLWGGGDPVRFISTVRDLEAMPADAAFAVWKAKTSAELLAEIEHRTQAGGPPLHEVEDGFIRSVGLGADCVPPLSITVDPVGVHFDPARPSQLEDILNRADFSLELVARAAQLRELIVSTGLSKYGVGTTQLARPGEGKHLILVTGQVEDDRSVLAARGPVTGNLDLLRRARAIEPDAFIIYRPHPDVDAGHRVGHIPDAVALELADAIDRATPISALLDLVDGVHVLSSLAGFEALLRGREVTTHGVPFYAGWGLTRDLGDVPVRREAILDLDQLVAGVLLVYPRYLDPLTQLPCTPEILVHRILSGVKKQSRLIVPLRRLQGKVNKWRKRAGSVEEI